MAEYMTEQKRALKKILEDNSDKAYTVDELMELMRVSVTEVPGKSTVYRLVTRLADEGIVKKFYKDNSRRAAYQIVMGESCDCHLHLKCMDCGKLIHLDDKVSDELLCAVKATSNFSVSEQATVLFGMCGDCKNTNTES